jgi:putative transposase
MRRGQQQKLPAFSAPQRSYLHLVGAYNWGNDRVHTLTVERKNSTSFIAFLEYVLVQVYPTGVVILVMDNASYHHSAAVRATLSLFQHRVRVVYLPAYCPELNLIERFWLFLKATATANKLFASRAFLEENVSQIIASQNDPTSSMRLLFSKNFQ